jgi:hypothetical protein
LAAATGENKITHDLAGIVMHQIPGIADERAFDFRDRQTLEP